MNLFLSIYHYKNNLVIHLYKLPNGKCYLIIIFIIQKTYIHIYELKFYMIFN